MASYLSRPKAGPDNTDKKKVPVSVSVSVDHENDLNDHSVTSIDLQVFPITTTSSSSTSSTSTTSSTSSSSSSSDNLLPNDQMDKNHGKGHGKVHDGDHTSQMSQADKIQLETTIEAAKMEEEAEVTMERILLPGTWV